MKKQEKVFFVDNLKAEITDAKSVILVNYEGLTVKLGQELKKRLKEAGAKFLVSKNTLFKRAGKETGINENVLSDSVLSGQTALVISDKDPITALQVLGKFAKEFEVPKLKVGIVEGDFFDTEALTKLSTLPGRNILLGQFLGVLIGPLYGLTETLGGNLQKLVYILNLKTQSSDLKTETQN